MPYWSSSKVGAVSQSQGQQKKKSGSYRRGITLSDLKKQTAIRLAKEQQQNDELSFAHDRSRSDFGAPRAHDSLSRVPYVHGAPSSQHFSHEVMMSASNNYYGATSHQNRGNTAANVRDFNNASVPILTTDVPKSKVQTRNVPENPKPTPIPSSSSGVDSSVKTKLPHGLTVHELKAMTKARLQAEAIEKRTDMRNESYIPVSTQASLDMRDRSIGSPMVPSQIIKKGNQPSMADTYYQHESWSHDSRNDPWESGSVSTQTSEYFGSEKGFGSLEDGAYGNRTRSFSANNALGQDFRRDSPSPVVTHPVSFYDNYAPNRRRAATLSPRAGLLHLHEDHPLIGGPELPGLSSFSSPRNEPPSLHNVNPAFDRFNSTVYQEPNRTRTSSTVSMPSLSHTSEEFAHHSSLSKFGSVPEDVIPVTGLSDAFRNTSALYDKTLGENRARASTWAATSGVNDLFVSCLIESTVDSTNEISDELASILKLSGAEDRDVSSQLTNWM